MDLYRCHYKTLACTTNGACPEQHQRPDNVFFNYLFISKDAAQGQKQKVEKKPATRCSLKWDSQKKDHFWLQRCLDTPLLKALKS